ncbi:hypothetical protein AB0P17_40065 [Streptomyces sp. NPDC088124]|uniref:hypothetical protein n=1 Tax=Streptomyces sp. NPDC088124 TaxID=3154654 RepID=UPI00341A36BA
MSGASGGTTGGPMARPRAWGVPLTVLFTVLAALLHVLGCAHGPVPAAPSAGVPAGLSVVAYQPSAGEPALPAAGCAGRASHGASTCTDTDEPSVLPQRPDGFAAATADRTLPGGTAVRNTAAPPVHPARDGAPAGAGAEPDHRRRAALGVWRN